MKKIDVSKYDKLTEAVQILDLMKKRCLQIEFLGEQQIQPEVKMETLLTVDDLLTSAKQYIKQMEQLITKPRIRKLEESGNYEDYTRKSFGRKFWNEIELPAQVEDYANRLSEILDLKFNENHLFELSVYDLSDYSFYFSSQDEVDAVVEIEDVAPAMVFELRKAPEGSITPYESIELYNI